MQNCLSIFITGINIRLLLNQILKQFKMSTTICNMKSSRPILSIIITNLNTYHQSQNFLPSFWLEYPFFALAEDIVPLEWHSQLPQNAMALFDSIFVQHKRRLHAVCAPTKRITLSVISNFAPPFNNTNVIS
jgi:hypothetical protein